MKNALKLAAGVAATVMIAQSASAATQEADQLAHGRQVFQQWCAACHSSGHVYPGTVALEAKYKGAVPAALEQRTDLTPEMIKYFVRHGISVMPFFRKTEISDADLSALGAYLSKSSAAKTSQ